MKFRVMEFTAMGTSDQDLERSARFAHVQRGRLRYGGFEWMISLARGISKSPSRLGFLKRCGVLKVFQMVVSWKSAMVMYM